MLRSNRISFFEFHVSSHHNRTSIIRFLDHPIEKFYQTPKSLPFYLFFILTVRNSAHGMRTEPLKSIGARLPAVIIKLFSEGF